MANKIEWLTRTGALGLLALALACRGGEKPAPPAGPVAPAKAQAAPQEKALTYEEEIAKWKKGRIDRLTADDGWLTVSGLIWLEQGANGVGSAKANHVLLPADAPAKVGTIELRGSEARFVPDPAAGAKVGDAPAAASLLRTDADGDPTIVSAGPVSFFVIKRGDKLAVRVKDKESAARRNFKGIESYPVDARWRIRGRFEPYQPPKKLSIINILGMTEQQLSPGAVSFEIDGKAYRIDPVIEEGSSDYFVMFADKTSGKETYGAGRYLYVTPPGPDGLVTIDFNKAYNPPCAFTKFATCPLPPPQNRLPIAVTAGEKKYEGEH